MKKACYAIMANGNLCANEYCMSCRYCTTHDMNHKEHASCDYIGMTGRMRLTEPGEGCTKWERWNGKPRKKVHFEL